MRCKNNSSFRITALLAMLALIGCAEQDSAAGPEPAPGTTSGLDILILGGTGFIGPHMVREAEARGHTVTLFNRGRTSADLFPHLETLIGDRDGQLQALEGRRWDAVIDNSGYVPRHCRDSAELLAPNVGQYLFISTISVYADYEEVGIDEDYALGQMDDESVEQVTGETYGPMKVLCERAVQAAIPDSTTIVRPGYIVGPGDRSDRWTYWAVRVAQGGEVAVPGTPDDPMQYIDARDLAKFVMHLLETRTLGVFNAVGPNERITMAEMLDTLKAVSGSEATFSYVAPAWLEERSVVFPVWTSPADGPYRGVLQISNERARMAGLTHRPTAEIARDTLKWWNNLEKERRDAMRSGLRILEDPPGGRPLPESMQQQMATETKLLADLAAGTPD